MKAYVLFKLRTGEVRDVLRELKRVEAITEVSMTFGPFDAVAVVKAKDLSDLGHLLATVIQPIPGVLETLTCLAVDV
jgi:DNA-binding Lrp family transcriptional regulator